MGNLFSKPSAPDPPPVPDISDTAPNRIAEMRNLARRRGRASTLLAGADIQRQQEKQTKTLLGQ